MSVHIVEVSHKPFVLSFSLPKYLYFFSIDIDQYNVKWDSNSSFRGVVKEIIRIRTYLL